MEPNTPDKARKRNIETIQFSFEKYQAIAKQLIDYLPELSSQDSDDEGEERGVKWGDEYGNLPPDILSRYWGHGVSRGFNDIDFITSVLAIADLQAIVGDTAPLRGSGWIDAYSAPFIVVGHRNQQLLKKEGPGPFSPAQLVRLEAGQGNHAYAAKADIGVIICTGDFAALVKPLSERFPNIRFVSPEGFVDYVHEEEAAANSEYYQTTLSHDPSILERLKVDPMEKDRVLYALSIPGIESRMQRKEGVEPAIKRFVDQNQTAEPEALLADLVRKREVSIQLSRDPEVIEATQRVLKHIAKS